MTTYIIYGCAVVAAAYFIFVVILLGFLAYAMIADNRTRRYVGRPAIRSETDDE